MHNLPIWQPLAAGLVLVVLSLLALRLARRHPYLLVGWGWYLFTLLPVIGLVQVGGQAMADRYTYVPFIGLFIVLVWGMAGLAARWHAPKFLLPVGAGVVISALMVCTWVQVRYWRDSITLYEHALEVTRRNLLIHNNLGLALAAQGKMDQAEAHYAEALRLNPNLAEPHNNWGLALAAQGKMDQAEAHYAEALRLNPNLCRWPITTGGWPWLPRAKWIRPRPIMPGPCVLIPIMPWPITTGGWPWRNREKLMKPFLGSKKLSK